MKNHRRGIFLMLLISVFFSCKKLKVEEFELNKACKIYGTEWVDTLVNPKKGVYYASVDTSNCILVLKYDDNRTNVDWVNAFLYKKGLHYIPEITKDSTIFENSLMEKTIVEPVVEQNPEQKTVQTLSRNKSIDEEPETVEKDKKDKKDKKYGRLNGRESR